MTPLKIKKAREMYHGGEQVDAIAETLGVSRKTVYRHLS
jgi:transposase-like protein